MQNSYLGAFCILLLTSCAVHLPDNKKAEIKSELAKMIEIDQIKSNLRQGKYLDYTQEEWQKFRDSVQAENTAKTEKIFDDYGFLGYKEVGEDGAEHFFVLVQHTNELAFQKRVLKAMKKEVSKGNANPRNYAYLYDRVQVNEGKKQLFGTQLDFDANGRPFPKIGLLDSANVDKLRNTYDLEPLQDYYDFYMEYKRKDKN